ncbi:aspartate aminotransferase family protein [Flammeovirga kamogawensis]|uniref:Aminotransferase class III-fold pyridoxal phosphate-dependent enzyme n=1 Tax=Flammeovirga kamogawensis TaxID=373891 RepID=A0ABX8GYW5_9BACT|nr:aminotransferase class III-fold pyridoxal phosphate-dependent enzyme [Flammeovirga kamogawensis]MBB6459235.1 acetylornithine aminotransferase [Flammeovirga kamogawensis]QWG08799.1 aminotransferase class III-fold pyridoxal phosphate-dependent enzyme [Flammeovirga kamogawensis]TRX67089.1 aspartate aminotransferase family protein [Flammeovirga kamogawensis]
MANLFDVYPLFNIEPVKGEDVWIYDKNDEKYLDLYGGHAVISIGHSHPHYKQKLSDQLDNLVFYSNSIQNPLQKELAEKLGEASCYHDWNLFLCNSGAEANENAFKLASFYNKKTKIISFSKGFHGRTSLAVATTDNPNIVAPVNAVHDTLILPFNDVNALKKAFSESEICAVIIEGIQGIGGIYEPTEEFMQTIRTLCDETNAVFIADEIQSGYGRSGRFFAHQWYNVTPDVVTMAKGMGNGFPIGGVFISPKFEASYGMLGTTFGGNHLACAAGIAVLDVLAKENLIEKSVVLGEWIVEQLKDNPSIKEIRGKGLMLGIEMNEAVAPMRKQLLFDHKIFTGASSNKNTIRLLPPLTLTQEQAQLFVDAFNAVTKELAQ